VKSARPSKKWSTAPHRREGPQPRQRSGQRLHKISALSPKSTKFSRRSARPHQTNSPFGLADAKATNRLTEITQEISSAVEEQASRRASRRSAPWTRCANSFSSRPPAHRAIRRPPKQMLKLPQLPTRWIVRHRSRHTAATQPHTAPKRRSCVVPRIGELEKNTPN